MNIILPIARNLRRRFSQGRAIDDIAQIYFIGVVSEPIVIVVGVEYLDDGSAREGVDVDGFAGAGTGEGYSWGGLVG